MTSETRRLSSSPTPRRFRPIEVQLYLLLAILGFAFWTVRRSPSPVLAVVLVVVLACAIGRVLLLGLHVRGGDLVIVGPFATTTLPVAMIRSLHLSAGLWGGGLVRMMVGTRRMAFPWLYFKFTSWLALVRWSRENLHDVPVFVRGEQW